MKQSIIITAIALLAVTGVSVRSQTQQPRRIQHDVLILQGQGINWHLTDEIGTKYQWSGIALYNSDGSAGAPKYQFDPYPYPTNYGTNRLAQETANALDSGFVIKHISSDSYNVTVTLVRER